MIGLDDGDSSPRPKHPRQYAEPGTSVFERWGKQFHQKDDCSPSFTTVFSGEIPLYHTACGLNLARNSFLVITKTSDKECLMPQQVSHEGFESKASGDGEVVCFGMVSHMLP